MNEKTQINKQTYYMMPLDLLMVMNAYGFKTSNYKLNKTDLKNKWYIPLNYNGINFKIPFKALFHTNSKIKGIKGLDFNNASYCTGYLLNKCQIPCQKYCYSYVFEMQYLTSTTSKQGFMTFNAYYKGFLLTRAFNVLYNDIRLYNRFIEYINKKIKVLRFNVNSDFNNANDWNLILDIALLTNVTVYGYTTRDDLLKGYNMLKSTNNNYNNLFVNGSNKCYDNKYKVTFSLETYFKALNKCLGACNDCKKCFTLKNALITTLFHNSNSDTILNTLENRLFMVKLLNAIDNTLNITETDLKAYKGIFKSIDAFLIKNNGFKLETLDITNIKGLLDYIYYVPRMEFKSIIMDGMANKTVLKEYGLI